MNQSVMLPTERLVKLSIILLACSLVFYGFGVSSIYAAMCKPTIFGIFAPIGVALALVAFGVHLGYAVLNKRVRTWFFAIGVLFLSGAMTGLFYIIAVVRCSGV